MTRRCRIVLLATAALIASSGCGDDRPPPPLPDAGFPPLCPLEIDPVGCRADRDCGSSICRASIADPAVDGEARRLACGVATAGVAIGGRCDRSAECARGLCALGGTCVAPCESALDCVTSERCLRVRLADGDASSIVDACIPRVTPPPGVTANVRPAVPPPLDGWVDVGPEAGHTTFFSACGELLQVHQLARADPSADLLFDVTTIFDAPPPNPVAFSDSPLTMLVPSGSFDGVSSVGYLVRIVPRWTIPIEIVELRGARDGGILDLDLFYVGVDGFVPMGAALPPPVAAAIAELGTALASANVTVGEVRQHLVPGDLAFRLARLDGPFGAIGELSELFRLSAGVPTASIPIFFVQSAVDFLGLAGGIPGPWAMSGTEGSGVAIAASLLERDGLPLGHVVAHEVFHFLGLFHTTELDGTVVDSLDDTPSCTIDRDANGDAILDPTECVGAGADHLMFWAPDPGVGGVVTDGQLAVVRRALLLR